MLVHEVFESAKNVGKSQKEHGLIIQLIVVSTSNILCWFPVNTIYILAMFGNKQATQMVIWSTVVAFPLNSVVNPLVFVITCWRKHIKCFIGFV